MIHASNMLLGLLWLHSAVLLWLSTTATSAFVPNTVLERPQRFRSKNNQVCDAGWLSRDVLVDSGFHCRWGTRVYMSSTSSSSSETTRRGPQQQRPPPRNRSNFDNRRPSSQRGPREGGGGPSALRLENPMRVRRKKRQQQQQRQRSDTATTDRLRKSRTRAEDDDEDVGADSTVLIPKKKESGLDISSAASPPTEDTKGPARRAPGDVKRKQGRYGGQQPERQRQSLRTSKSRSASDRGRNRGSLKKRDRSASKEEKAERALERRTVQLPDGPVTVGQLAELIDEKPAAVVKFLMTDLGVMAAISQALDPATCLAVVEGFGKIVGSVGDEDDEELLDELFSEEGSALDVGYVSDEDDPDELTPRPPVVTIMGHVDHGKTSLLDALRETRVTAGEAGGITQHIAAYQVEHEGSPITFIDTPGHAAFSDMRERGANVTDIVILVVAADDGVKQQTADSIVCARQAGVPLVVAINKIDLPTADVQRVKSELTSYDVLTEDLGGDILSAEISAKDGTNLDELLSKVMLQAEVQQLKANPNAEAQGAIVEARVEKGLGTVATTLVNRGTLEVGDIFVAGATFGRVRTLIDSSDGKTRLDSAGPSTPVNVVGFDGIPDAGDILVVVDDEQVARELAESRKRIAREKESSSYQSGLLESVAASFVGGQRERREVCVLIKADVQGSAEALSRSLKELVVQNEEAVVDVKVVVSEAGDVTKSDIAIATVTPGTIILAFGCAATYDAQEDARNMGINIEYFSIVYDAIEFVEERMQNVLSPTPEGEYVGAATVQAVFDIGGVGKIAGSRCTDGYIKKGSNVRVMRGDKILTESKVKSLRSFKSEVEQIETGDECGIGLVDFEAFEEGDVIESYVEM